MARRFVSEFMWETGATFNTNSLKMPLSFLVGITNTGTTFSIAFVFISAESGAMFRWIHELLIELVFYDCPLPKVAVGDFAKELMAAFIVAREEADGETDDELVWTEQENIQNKIDIELARQATNKDIRKTVLQLCEHHGAKAIKKKLTNSKGYSKKKDSRLWISSGPG
jgi:hypothetical protein